MHFAVSIYLGNKNTKHEGERLGRRASHRSISSFLCSYQPDRERDSRSDRKSRRAGGPPSEEKKGGKAYLEGKFK